MTKDKDGCASYQRLEANEGVKQTIKDNWNKSIWSNQNENNFYFERIKMIFEGWMRFSYFPILPYFGTISQVSGRALKKCRVAQAILRVLPTNAE